MEPMNYIMSWAGAFVIVGALWHVFDRRIGAKVHRVWYAWTHPDELPAGDRRGFIFGQKAKIKFGWAIALAALQSTLIVWQGHINPLVELLTFFFEVPALMAGFYVAPLIDRVWTRKDQVLETIDAIESGEKSVKSLAQDAMERAGEAARQAIAPPPEAPPVALEIPSPEPVPAEIAKPEASPEPDHRAKLKKFTGGGS